jgi:hypothetical protein
MRTRTAGKGRARCAVGIGKAHVAEFEDRRTPALGQVERHLADLDPARRHGASRRASIRACSASGRVIGATLRRSQSPADEQGQKQQAEPAETPARPPHDPPPARRADAPAAPLPSGGVTGPEPVVGRVIHTGAVLPLHSALYSPRNPSSLQFRQRRTPPRKPRNIQQGVTPMPEIGEMAPDFTLPRDGGGEITLSALRPRAVVLYFYPKDDTSGCTKEAIAFTGLAPSSRPRAP